MKSIFKKISISAAILFSSITAFALPGISYSIPDVSGQYVYYQDLTFARESYVGIIYYDESTYALRYIAPRIFSKDLALPKLEMQVFVTLDPSKTNVELTGERVEPYPKSQEETDLINYLHDFLYEMTARRQKIGDLTQKANASQDYPQFGGEVTLEFDSLVPITNLKRISRNNVSTLELVTAGQLISSDDTSFSDFEGIPGISEDKSDSIKIKKAKPQDFSVSDEKTTTVSLDKNWNQSAENLWLLGDSAILVINSMPKLDEASSKIIKRRLLLGNDHTYPDWRKLSITEDKSALKIVQIFYNDLTGKFSRDFKLINDYQNLFSLTVYEKAYASNKKYFDSVIASYKIK